MEALSEDSSIKEPIPHAIWLVVTLETTTTSPTAKFSGGCLKNLCNVKVKAH